jgi:uncharacterized protein (DUF1697 family)
VECWIALLRGVNVGGHNKLPMPALKTALGASGFADVATYIQSGNIVFRHAKSTAPALAAQIGDIIAAQFGFRPGIKLLRRAELASAAKANPFPQAAQDDEGRQLHLFFLDGPPASGHAAAFDALRSPTESWALAGGVLYLHTPDGFGHSKLAAQAEKKLKTGTTARNWRSIQALLELSAV